jgi:hypothetical protein
MVQKRAEAPKEENGRRRRMSEFVYKYIIVCVETTENNKGRRNCDVRGNGMTEFLLIQVIRAFVHDNYV